MTRVRILSTVALALLSMDGSTVFAAGAIAPRSIDLLDFGQFRERSQSDVRRANVLDFAGAGPAKPDIVEQPEHLERALVEDFAAMALPTRVEAQQASSVVLARPASGFIRVPGWMRGRSLGSIISSDLPAIGRCAPRPYSPSTIMGRSAEDRRRLLYPLVHQAACEVGLPVGLMDAMIMQESRYNPMATSPVGAFGLGQLMPGTARDLGVDRYDLRANLRGAARYLKSQIDEFGQVHLALAAYNAGPARVRRTRSIPRIAETQNYVASILGNWRRLEGDSVRLARRDGPAALTRISLREF